MCQNKAAVEKVAETLIERREIHGDDVVELLDQRQPEARRHRLPRGADVATSVTNAAIIRCGSA